MVSGYLHVLLDVRRCSASFAKLTCFHHISDVWSVWLMKRREVKKKRLLIVNKIQVGELAFLTMITTEILKGDLTKIHQRAQPPQEVCTPFHCSHQMNLPLFFTCKYLNKNYHPNYVKQTNNLSKTPLAFSHSVFWKHPLKIEKRPSFLTFGGIWSSPPPTWAVLELLFLVTPVNICTYIVITIFCWFGGKSLPSCRQVGLGFDQSKLPDCLFSWLALVGHSGKSTPRPTWKLGINLLYKFLFVHWPMSNHCINNCDTNLYWSLSWSITQSNGLTLPVQAPV